MLHEMITVSSFSSLEPGWYCMLEATSSIFGCCGWTILYFFYHLIERALKKQENSLFLFFQLLTVTKTATDQSCSCLHERWLISETYSSLTLVMMQFDFSQISFKFSWNKMYLCCYVQSLWTTYKNSTKMVTINWVGFNVQNTCMLIIAISHYIHTQLNLFYCTIFLWHFEFSHIRIIDVISQ